MRKFKKWLIERYLPAYCKESLLEENKRLVRELAESRTEVDRLSAYIEGFHATMRRQRNIIIRNEVKP